MRFWIIAVMILVIGLTVAQVQTVDRALAYTDLSLRTLSKWTGNPQLLVDLRSMVHGYRYARAVPPAPLKMRIVRKGEPGTVLPAPEAVVHPQTYRYGVAPSRLSAPEQFIGSPGQPTSAQAPPPTGSVVAFSYRDDFDEKYPRNELHGVPKWERTFEGRVNYDVARDWTGYTVWGEPTLDGEYTTVRDGGWSQKISGHASFRAGIWRQFGAAPGTIYRVKVYGHLHVLGGGAVHIGVDPTGGVDPNASTVTWFPHHTDIGRWMEMTASGEVLAPTITVFLEGYSLFDDNTNAYFDDFELEVYQQ